ncbi:hypothetical protein NN6n1_13150 [Shinella zoogloeoides]
MMADFVEEQDADTLEVEGDAKSSARILAAIKKAERSLNAWQGLCDTIDEVYSYDRVIDAGWVDPDYDLFWSSMEIMKPAVYCHPPQPVVSPQFKDRRKLQNVTAEMLERSVTSGFERADIDESMLCVRDDLIFYNRGELWVTYETDEKGGGKRVCIDHVDRKDFLHPPARKWSEVPWAARRAWMTKKEMRKRFRKTSGNAYQEAALGPKPQYRDDGGVADHSRKVGVWEVWHKADDKVYWVAEGCSVLLDEDKPHLKLRGFFPCPRPAYGTLRPRTLVPVPDYVRYAGTFKKVNDLTKRIYDLLDSVRMKGLIPAGGEVGDAVEQAMRDDDNSMLLIPVPGAALMAGSSSGFVQWLPLEQVAAAITGLIEARGQLIEDFYQLSGISDIMRGATEASETLGAQQLKSQYGSVRVREKIEELQRIAKDVTQIVAEIMAENFDKDTLLEMSQMEIPSKADIQKQVKELEGEAKEELKALGDKAKQAAQQAQQSGQQIDPAQAQQQMQQAQQQIIAKYAPMINEAGSQVPIEDVMKLLRDEKARGFAFEIATDSTILTDEIAEKSARNEFLTVFTNATQGLTAMAAMGEPGAKLAGEVLKFVLQPYRVGRELNSVIDEFIDAAPKMAAAANQQGNGEAEKAMAEANQKIAEAELQKANAAIAKVEADTASKQQEMQFKAAEAAEKAKADQQRIALEFEQTRGSIAETNARIEKIMAEIQKIGVDAENQTRQQNREDVKTVSDISMRQTDQALSMQDRQRAAFESDRDAAMGQRQQEHSERQGERAENRADRQQDFAERRPA